MQRARFPVSTVVPTADIVATKKQDRNKNYVVELKARNMADPTRLTPPRQHYNVWIIADNGMTINLGRVSNRNAQKINFRAITPYNPRTIFITAEDQDGLTYPTGIEISRTVFNK